MTATDAALAKVYSGTDPAGFITTLGRRAYRRPLTTAEQSTYMTLYNQGSTLTGTRSTFAKGASLVIRAMLQSPYFLYRTELGANGAPLNGYEMAAKLSLWLRGTTPGRHDCWTRRPGPGKLDTADGAAALATTMLGEPTATTVMRQFHGELAALRRLRADLSKVGVSTYNDVAERRVPGVVVPVLRQHLHAGAGRERHPAVHDRLLSARGWRRSTA